MNSRDSGRRKFLQRITAATLAALGGSFYSSSTLTATPHQVESHSYPAIPEDGVVVFQGDSITDAGRDREHTAPNGQRGLGPGYVLLAAAELLGALPEKNLRCYNRGISGNKVFQLAIRWEEDCIQLQPDILSILIGVNDFWHALTHGYDGTSETYEQDFRALLDRTKEVLPDVQLIIGEPFALPEGSAVDESWFPTFRRYQEAARNIASDYKATFIEYQSVFNEASRHAPQTYWSADGVHPSTAGCYLMARAWLRTLQSMG